MPIKIKYKTTTEHEREEVVYFEPTKENLEAFLAPNERVVGGIEILEQWEDDSALPVVEDVIEEEIIEEEIIEEVTEDPYTYDYSIAETNTAKKEESVYYEDGISWTDKYYYYKLHEESPIKAELVSKYLEPWVKNS